MAQQCRAASSTLYKQTRSGLLSVGQKLTSELGAEVNKELLISDLRQDKTFFSLEGNSSEGSIRVITGLTPFFFATPLLVKSAYIPTLIPW